MSPFDIPQKISEKKREPYQFKDAFEAQAYLEWKKTVPVAVRGGVESVMCKKEYTPHPSGLPLSDEFINAFCSALRNGTADDVTKNALIGRQLNALERITTNDGFLNAFTTLVSEETSWEMKRRVYELQIKPIMEWLASRDLENCAQATLQDPDTSTNQEPKENQNVPPPTSEEVVSSMETGSEPNKEGEPQPPLFTVQPFFGRYLERFVFTTFDPKMPKWQKSKNRFEKLDDVATTYDHLAARVLSGSIQGNTALALPLPDHWVLDSGTLAINDSNVIGEITQNQTGHYYLTVLGEGTFRYAITIAPPTRIAFNQKVPEAAELHGTLPKELVSIIDELKKKRLPPMKLKREVVKAIRSHLVYSNSRDAWDYYTQDTTHFFERVWERREADCHVANTLAAAALAEIDPRLYFVAGHFVKERNAEGNAVLNQDNAHSWLKVWDEEGGCLVRLDATPKGDPTIDEEQQEKDLEGETGEGDYGDDENEIASEEETQKQLEQLPSSQGGGKKPKSKRPSFDLVEEQFADLAECTPNQAREFLEALDRVRKITNERGIPITELLLNEWKKIVTLRKIEVLDSKGPVRMDRGDRLRDPVSADIDMSAGEFNPTGFEKNVIIEKNETDFGGMNLFFSFDLSGSMGEPDAASGRRKADVQRDTALLFIDSLMQCAYVSRQNAQAPDTLPVRIMVTVASSTGKCVLPLTEKWGPKEQWAMYGALTQMASGGTPTHHTLQLIQKSMSEELKRTANKNIPPHLRSINYVVEIGDGAPDDSDKVELLHKELKKQGATVRSYVIGGVSSSKDAAPPIASFSDLPRILAEDVITQFKKLNPTVGKIV